MSTRSSRRLRTLALIGLLAASAIAVSGCSVLNSVFPAQAQRSSSSGKVTKAGQSDVLSVQVGDCFNDAVKNGHGTLSQVTAIPCTQKHEKEAYASIPLTGAKYPGEASIRKQSIAGCEAAFTRFVGIPPSKSTLAISWLVPTADSWDTSVDSSMCLVYAVDSSGNLAVPVVGSLKNSKR